MITHPWPNDPEQEDKFLLLSFPVVTPASAMMLADTTETETLGHDPCHQGMESKNRRLKEGLKKVENSILGGGGGGQ